MKSHHSERARILGSRSVGRLPFEARMLTSRCRSLGVVIAAALALLTLRPAPARAGEAFYLLMFGSQRIPNEPNYAHSFATFVRASWPGDGPCPPAGAALEPYTISWLPQKLPVRTYALLPECGHNYGLRETIQYSLCEKERISLWGAYLICPELFYRAVRQYELLNSGRVRYKAIDSGFPSDKVSNCMHAISSISDGYRLRIASPGWGQMASFSILK